MRNNLLLLHFFSIFLNPQRVTLTYSAMTDGPIDVQLRWANLRAREHHVKGPKKSPRKMVLRRLILRKAEEAKRTTTWAPYRVQCPCLQCQNQPRWILLNFPSVDMGTLSKTVGFSLYPSNWVIGGWFVPVIAKGGFLDAPCRNYRSILSSCSYYMEDFY